MQNSPLREQGRRVIAVDVIDMPIEVELRAGQHFNSAVGIYRFQALGLSAVMHVRLERQQPRGFHQREITIRAHVVGIRAKVDLGHADRCGRDHVFRDITLRIELQTKRNIRRRLRANRMEVKLEVNLRSRLD